MKIAVIQGSSQKDKNEIIYETIEESIKDKKYKVINFGVFKEEDIEYSYIEISILISILLESKAVDFVVTGCSSGQGMMLACNSLPSIICGYIENPTDAYLFGRINNGNAISIPLGLNFGWASEINLKCIFEQLFNEAFGIGYPKKDAKRKKKDTDLLKTINGITKRNLIEVLSKIDRSIIEKVIKRKEVISYVIEHGQDKELNEFLKGYF